MQQSNHFCAFKGPAHQKMVVDVEPRTCFLAHPFEAPYLQVAAAVESELETHGITTIVPKRSDSGRGLLFCDVLCPMLKRSVVFLADISTSNHNVYFEIGYAEGLGKHVYLFRNTDVLYQHSFLHDYGLFINEYSTSAEIVARLVEQSSSWNRQAYSLFDGVEVEERERSVAVLTPDHRFHRSKIAPAVRDCIRNHRLDLVEEHDAGSDLIRTFRTVKASEWVIGTFLGDNIQDAGSLNARVAFWLGLSVALGKKVLLLQQSPSSKPMIDLSGLTESFTQTSELQDILARRLDIKPRRVLERREGQEDHFGTRQLSKSGLTVEQNSNDLFAALTGEAAEDLSISNDSEVNPDLDERDNDEPSQRDGTIDEDQVTIDLDNEAETDDSDLVLRDGSDVNLSFSDSGISLESEDGSEIQVDPDFGTDLTDSDSGINLGSGPLDLGADSGDEEFQLNPVGDFDDDDESGDQVIYLDDSEEYDGAVEFDDEVIIDVDDVLDSDDSTGSQVPEEPASRGRGLAKGRRGFFRRLFSTDNDQ